MSMILRRNKSKKKLKKAQQLQEAQQQAYLASLQQQQQNGFPSTMSVPSLATYMERDETNIVEGSASGSDPDTEIFDSASLSSQQQQQKMSPHTAVYEAPGRNNSPPSFTTSVPYSSSTLPVHLPPSAAGLQHQFSFPVSSTIVSNQTPPPTTTKDNNLLRRGSHPVLPMTIPATVAEIPGVTMSLPPAASFNAQQTILPSQSPNHMPQRNGGTLVRKTKEPKKISPQKAELISNALSFGLGRGIDATDKKPWLNKKPYQVRRVNASGIMETKEGDLLMNYDHEVQSSAEMEEHFLGSLNPPESTVTIHIEDELDRNISSSRRVVGHKIMTRSIGFQADFEEKYMDGEVAKLNKESILIPKDPAEVVYNTQQSGLTFEERVCQWILHRLAQKCGIALYKTADESSTDRLAKVLQAKAAQGIENEIKSSCLELIQNLKVTHYVTGIQLGAMDYRILSDSEYHKKLATEGAFGVDKLANVLSTQQMKLNKRKCSELRKIGKIDDDHRVSKDDETVLQIRVQPIIRLIKLPILKSALTAAISKYMEGTHMSEGGPFVIKCTGRDLYLTANKFNNYEVEATDIPTEASLFYFQTTDDGGNPFEFHIAYYGEDVDPNDQTTTPEQSSIGRYLEAPLSAQGRCPGPLLMKHSVKVKNTRFTLRSRLSKKNNKSHLADWIAGEDAFYIACATKKYQHGSYLAVKNIKHTGDLIGKHFFMTYCDPSIHNHNGDNTMMLFQLCMKESILNKSVVQNGRGTPGKLPFTNTAKEVIVRDHKMNSNARNGSPLVQLQ